MAVEKLFAEMDANGNGKIDAEELRRGLGDVLGVHMSEEEAARLAEEEAEAEEQDRERRRHVNLAREPCVRLLATVRVPARNTGTVKPVKVPRNT